MRGLLALALLLLMTVPVASAQMAPHLDLQVQAPIDPVGPEGAQVTVTVALVCPNQAMVLPDQMVALAIQGPPGSIYDGPESLRFASRPCLSQPVEEQVATYTIRVPTDANASTFQYRIEAEPRGSYNGITQPPNSADVQFVLSTPPAPAVVADEAAPTPDACVEPLADAAQEAAADPAVANVPGLGWLAPLAGLAVALVRRRAA